MELIDVPKNLVSPSDRNVFNINGDLIVAIGILFYRCCDFLYILRSSSCPKSTRSFPGSSNGLSTVVDL